jgi:hypothetical protein
MQLVRANQESIAQSAIHHDADDFELGATVSGTFSACIALAAIQIGFDATRIPSADMRHTGADFKHFDPQLMPRNPWECEEWEFA